MPRGIFSYNVEYGARPDELARAAEERGFESFWVGEHTHIPAARKTPYPGGGPRQLVGPRAVVDVVAEDPEVHRALPPAQPARRACPGS